MLQEFRKIDLYFELIKYNKPVTGLKVLKICSIKKRPNVQKDNKGIFVSNSIFLHDSVPFDLFADKHNEI